MRAGRGLLSLLALAVAAVAVLALIAYLLGAPRPSPASKKLEQPVEARARAVAPPRDDGRSRRGPAATRRAVLEVSLELEEGDFEILPSKLGSSIRIDADYDDTFYRLKPAYAPEAGRFDLVFEHRSRFRQLRSFLHDRRTSEGNRVRVHLPAGVPMDLSLRIRRGQAVVDLSGLMVHALAVDHAMGETEVRFAEPNPIDMETLDIHGRMGELTATGLGHAAARLLLLDGKMGDFRLDFGGHWRTDTSAAVRVTMGDAQLRVPPEVRLHVTGRNVLLGGLLTHRDASPPDPERAPEARTLVLEASVRLGELQVR